MATKKTPEFRTAVQIILVFGIISMLADMVYEGAEAPTVNILNCWVLRPRKWVLLSASGNL